MDTDIYRHVVDGSAERASTLIEGVFAQILNLKKMKKSEANHEAGAKKEPLQV